MEFLTKFKVANLLISRVKLYPDLADNEGNIPVEGLRITCFEPCLVPSRYLGAVLRGGPKYAALLRLY